MALDIPASLFRDSTPPDLTKEQEKLKLDLYNKIPARRRKFIDRIGFENWDPFPKPNDPLDIRRDVSERTTQELIREFLQSRPEDENQSNGYRQAALEIALGIIGRDEKYLGYFDFSMWYYNLLLSEGFLDILPKQKTKEEIEQDKAEQEQEEKNQG